jgi:hypothetical protein
VGGVPQRHRRTWAEATLIVPSRTFSAGRVLRSLASGAERRFRLTRLVQRGADFERLAFEETVA